MDSNDPHLDKFKELEEMDLASLTIMDGVGAEMFAKHAFDFADTMIRAKTNNRCYVVEVECMEHGANSAIYSKK
jgi:6-pyruvoyltetrahydropterin/6-carboxytetrahydropterin synthase